MGKTKHAFPAYSFYEQKRYMRRHLIKPRSMRLRSFISRLQELHVYLADFPSDPKGQETVPLPADEIMDIIYHFMPITWKSNIIEQGFNYADSTIKKGTDFFETRVESVEPKGKKEKYSAIAKRVKDEKSTKKRKQEDSNSRVVGSSKDSSVEYRKIKKYCTLHRKCSHTTDK